MNADLLETEMHPLKTLMQQVSDLPALPDAVTHVMRLVDDPKASLADVGRALVCDQALAVRTLKLANSSFYGASRRIATVSEAVVLLGMQTTRTLVMATGCEELLEQEVSGYALPRGALLRRSLTCAAAAQALAKRARCRRTEEAFVAGLLHDIGKVILNTYRKDQFMEVIIRAASGEVTYAEAERDILGFDHAEAGAFLLEQWQLPASLVAAVRYHHAPLDAGTDSPLPSLVHLADAICMALGVGLGLDGLAYMLQPEALRQLALTEQDFEEVTSEVCDTLAQADLFFV